MKLTSFFIVAVGNMCINVSLRCAVLGDADRRQRRRQNVSPGALQRWCFPLRQFYIHSWNRFSGEWFSSEATCRQYASLPPQECSFGVITDESRTSGATPSSTSAAPWWRMMATSNLEHREKKMIGEMSCCPIFFELGFLDGALLTCCLYVIYVKN